MHSYDAYGLGICSEVPVPAFAAGTGRADVVIRTADLQDEVRDLKAQDRAFDVDASQIRIYLSGIGSFVVRSGREVLVDPAEDVDQRWVQLGIVGPVLAALLVQRDFLILHASCVAVGGDGVAFVGAALEGKSTMAATLHARGHVLVTDDIVAIRFDDAGVPTVFPGFPQFKLWPDALAALGSSPDDLPRIAPNSEKRARRLKRESLSNEPVPLSRIYLLSGGDTPSIEDVPPARAYFALLAHSYGVHWLHSLAPDSTFFGRARLTHSVPVRHLRRPRDLALLPTLADLVEEDMSLMAAAPNGVRSHP